MEQPSNDTVKVLTFYNHNRAVLNRFMSHLSALSSPERHWGVYMPFDIEIQNFQSTFSVTQTTHGQEVRIERVGPIIKGCTLTFPNVPVEVFATFNGWWHHVSEMLLEVGPAGESYKVLEQYILRPRSIYTSEQFQNLSHAVRIECFLESYTGDPASQIIVDDGPI